LEKRAILSTPLGVLIIACLTGYFLYSVVFIAISTTAEIPTKYQWDFRMYYYTTKAYFQGLNPYNPSEVASLAGERLLEYFYFPFSFYIFKPLTLLSFETAAYLFLTLKCGLLLYLLGIWRKLFDFQLDLTFLLLVLFGFNSTLYLDFRAGNVSIVEQAFLWTSFYFLLQRRLFLFCFFVTLASIFKVAMLAFALLLFTLPKEEWPRGIAYMAACILFIVATIAIPDYRIFQAFLSHVGSIISVPWDVGTIAPSSFTFIRALSEVFQHDIGFRIPEHVQSIVYLIWIATVITLSFRALRRLDLGTPDAMRFAIGLACLMFVLIVPRCKDYSYILLIAPTCFILTRLRETQASLLLLILCILSASYVPMPGMHIVASLVWSYYPFLLAAGIWMIYLTEIHGMTIDGRDKNRTSDAASPRLEEIG
jgi:hypothetical protein